MTHQYNIQDTIAKLKSLDLDNTSCQEIIDYFLSISSQGFIGEKLPKGTQICRMRILDLNNFEIPIYSTELSYNPKPSIYYGRCNLPNETIFYGSLNTDMKNHYMNIFFEVTNEETRKNKKIPFIISSWELMEEITVVNVGTKLKHSLNQSSLRTQFFNQFNSISNVFRENALIFDTFISEEFSKNISKNTDYLISASYSKYVLNYGFAGLIYPSVQTNGAGLNIALRTEVINQGLLIPNHALFGIQYFKDNNSFSDHLMSGDINGNGIILWKDLPKDLISIEAKKYFNDEINFYPLGGKLNYKDLD